MRLYRRLVAVTGAAACCLVVASPASAVTGGTTDSDHDYVVAIIPAGASHPTCSGVWTHVGHGRHVVVTDAHCVSRTDGANVHVYFGRQWAPGAHTLRGHSYRHPSYDARTHRNDVAVVVLTTTPRVEAATLAPAGDATRARSVTIVGFGSPHTGQRRSASETVTSWSSWRLYLRPGSGNSCGGDSGGPDLEPGTDQIVALTDEGTCSRDEDTRLDQGAAREFVTAPR